MTTGHRQSAASPGPAPGIYVKSGPNGTPLERVASTPTEAVALVFDGWQPQSTAPPAASPTAKTR